MKTANETATGLLGGSGFKYSASPSMRLINPIYFRKQSVTNPISNNVRMILNYVMMAFHYVYDDIMCYYETL